MKRSLLLFVLLFSGLITIAQDKPIYDIVTYRGGSFLGTINIELFPLIAPLHVANFDTLAITQFYDSTAFHRVIPGFVIQGGDPNSINGPKSTWGQGQPWQPTVPAEFNAVPHVRGVLSAARSSNINSATSQFFICVGAAPWLNLQYSAYGRVLSGMDIVDSIVLSPRDANDCPFQKIEMFVTRIGYNDTVPDAPTGLVPAHNSTGVPSSVKLNWLPAYDAVLYEIELSDDSLFTNIINSGETADTFFTVNNLQSTSSYYWRVKTNNGGYLSNWTSPHLFQTGLPGPNLISPLNGSNNINIPVQLVWNSISTADSYKVQVARSSSFPAASIVIEIDSISDTTITVSSLLPNTNYYWRVQARAGADLGFYSFKFSFRSGMVIGLEESALFADRINVFPQPASETVYFEMKDLVQGDLQIIIYDALGKIVMEESAFVSDGDVTWIFDVSNFTSGNYYLLMRSGNALHTQPLLIAR